MGKHAGGEALQLGADMGLDFFPRRLSGNSKKQTNKVQSLREINMNIGLTVEYPLTCTSVSLYCIFESLPIGLKIWNSI
jgi:hypothetical protein